MLRSFTLRTSTNASGNITVRRGRLFLIVSPDGAAIGGNISTDTPTGKMMLRHAQDRMPTRLTNPA
jgi:uncharacterized protein involved in high-affinity Fe2+ transport